MLAHARACDAAGTPVSEIQKSLVGWLPPPAPPTLPLQDPGPSYFFNMDIADIEGDDGSTMPEDNALSVIRHMDALMRVPTVRAGAVMPDACPADKVLGTIPVGGIIATENAIHPGMHSADICCSVAFSNLGQVHPLTVLNAASQVTHFGPGGRDRNSEWNPRDFGHETLVQRFRDNRLLADQKTVSNATAHFGTQGDGNHFFYVGFLPHTMDTVIVTHHGSRGPGGALYRTGMTLAEAWRKKLSPDTPKHNAWIPADTSDGYAYWEALQTLRLWTRASHFAIHDRVAAVVGAGVRSRFWNEHNFVFRKDDGLYYHAKGATPMWNYAPNDDLVTNLRLVPLNAAAPILTLHGGPSGGSEKGLQFAPHGAGRNMSRSAHMRKLGPVDAAVQVRKEMGSVFMRAHNRNPDLSELPSAYKDADSIIRQIETYRLATDIGRIEPYGCIMAGGWIKRGKRR
jgi:RNA-splicing ligase RtcB